MVFIPPDPQESIPMESMLFGEELDGAGGGTYELQRVKEDKYIEQYFEKDTVDNTKSHIFLNSTRIASIKNNDNPYYYNSDHLGSNNLITDSSGNILELSDYLPYGKINYETGSSENEYKYTDKLLDSENSLQYFGARYMDNEIGRFVSMDPHNGDMSNPQSLNKYAYALNNPLRYNDPTGNDTGDALWGYVVGRVETFVDNVTNAVRSTSGIANNPLAAAPSALSNAYQSAQSNTQQIVNYSQAFCSDPSGTLQDTATGLQMSYDEFASQSDYEQGKSIGSLTENVSEAVILGKATQSGLNYLSSPYVPNKAYDVLGQIEKNNFKSAPQGYKGGGIFNNKEGLLPSQPRGYYQKWDVDPKPTVPGVRRASERIVTGQGGEAYYTPDHYTETFIRIDN